MKTNPEYDPKTESVRFTAYWEGYDRGVIDGKAGGYVMPEPKFTPGNLRPPSEQENDIREINQQLKAFRDTWSRHFDAPPNAKECDSARFEALVRYSQRKDPFPAPWESHWPEGCDSDPRSEYGYDKLPLPPNQHGLSGWLVSASGHLYRRTLPKHRFIRLDGSPLESPAAK